MSEDTKLLISVAAVVVLGAAGLALMASCSAERDSATADSRTPQFSAVPASHNPPPVEVRPMDFAETVSGTPVEPEVPVPEPFRIEPGEKLMARAMETFQAREFGKSVAYLEAELAERPDRAWTYYMHGLALWKSGRPDEAAAALRRSAELNPDSIKTFVNLSRVENDRGQYQAALEAAQAALVIDGADPSALFLEGRSLSNLGREDEALESLSASLDIDPDNGYALNLYGLILIDSGRPAEAVAILARAAELQPEVAYIHNNLGMARELSGEKVDAVAAYRRAVEVDAEHEKAVLNLARLEPLVPVEPAESPEGEEAVAEGTGDAEPLEIDSGETEAVEAGPVETESGVE